MQEQPKDNSEIKGESKINQLKTPKKDSYKSYVDVVVPKVLAVRISYPCIKY